jgi:hypothetical protein
VSELERARRRWVGKVVRFGAAGWLMDVLGVRDGGPGDPPLLVRLRPGLLTGPRMSYYVWPDGLVCVEKGKG